jgi:eukaryotic-like serine/threonine-protein kinase
VTSDLRAQLQAALGAAYTIDRELGGGGMSHVFVARDEGLGREIVIKVLAPALAAGVSAERFTREIKLAAALQEPHIVPVLSAGVTTSGLPFYTMPFVHGHSLRARIETGRLPFSQVSEILRNVAHALAYAHAHGVVHRDIKPENVLLSSGTAVVTDFGIAKALRLSKTMAPGGTLTEAGSSLGTPAYMAPEQAAGDEVDERADLYSWGVIAYELLAGKHPFHDKKTAQQLMTAHLAERPKDLLDQLAAQERNDPAVRSLGALVMRCLEKQPSARVASADELLATLEAASPRDRARAPRTMMAIGAAAIVVALVSGFGLWRTREKARATALLPRIQTLAAAGNYTAAYSLAERARRYLDKDSTFQAVFATISNEISVKSEPAGARVFIAAFGDSTIADSSDGKLIGTTPIDRYVVARRDYRVLVRAPGHEPARRVVSRFLTPSEGFNPADRSIQLDVRLLPSGSVPEGMEPVPGGRYQIVGNDIGRGQSAELAPFAVDRFEVSNDRFAEFVRAGGYRNSALWPAEATTSAGRLVDKTGLPAPRDWLNGEPPPGRGSHPVTGVSWPEAAAYCAWRGKRLPSLFEWEKASRNGRISRLGVLMPWGYYDPHSLGVARANFSGAGTAPVESFPFAISPYGIYNMGGNAKEWIANRVGDGWGTTGGSWQDPMYLFSQVGSQSGAGSAAIGFRCAKTLAPNESAQGAEPLPVATTAPVYHPVSAAAFPALLEHYRYDRIPPNPRGRAVTETADWIRERLWIDGSKGDSVLLYLYLPRSAEPPFQTLVHIPSSAAFGQSSVPQTVEDVAAGLLKAGRAVLAPVFTGMIERQGAQRGRLPPNSVEFRDLMVLNATEMRLAMDYASTRPDIDSTRFAYIAVSFGAGSRLPFAAVDPRFRAVVLLGAGIDERIQPTLPEAANFNFAPYIRAPKLVINGRQDDEHPWQTRAKPLWDLLREPKELLLVEGAGHVVPVEIRTPRINAFFDRALGPVTPKRR